MFEEAQSLFFDDFLEDPISSIISPLPPSRVASLRSLLEKTESDVNSLRTAEASDLVSLLSSSINALHRVHRRAQEFDEEESSLQEDVLRIATELRWMLFSSDERAEDDEEDVGVSLAGMLPESSRLRFLGLASRLMGYAESRVFRKNMALEWLEKAIDPFLELLDLDDFPVDIPSLSSYDDDPVSYFLRLLKESDDDHFLSTDDRDGLLEQVAETYLMKGRILLELIESSNGINDDEPTDEFSLSLLSTLPDDEVDSQLIPQARDSFLSAGLLYHKTRSCQRLIPLVLALWGDLEFFCYLRARQELRKVKTDSLHIDLDDDDDNLDDCDLSVSSTMLIAQQQQLVRSFALASMRLFETSLEYYDERQDLRGQARVQIQLGRLLARIEPLGRGVKYLESAVRIAREAKAQMGLVVSMRLDDDDDDFDEREEETDDLYLNPFRWGSSSPRSTSTWQDEVIEEGCRRIGEIYLQERVSNFVEGVNQDIEEEEEEDENLDFDLDVDGEEEEEEGIGEELVEEEEMVPLVSSILSEDITSAESLAFADRSLLLAKLRSMEETNKEQAEMLKIAFDMSENERSTLMRDLASPVSSVRSYDTEEREGVGKHFSLTFRLFLGFLGMLILLYFVLIFFSPTYYYV